MNRTSAVAVISHAAFPVSIIIPSPIAFKQADAH
jgi:hypothetical protein